MIALGQLLAQYQSRKIALPAFNIDSFEIFQAVESAVRDTQLPCLVQLSPREDTFIEAERLFMLVRRANIHGLPIYLNMDHGQDIPRLLSLATLGFDMLHFDGSFQDFTTNLSTTKYFVDKARAVNPQLVVEGEFNRINLVDAVISSDSYTSPSQADEFVKNTGINLLAVSIGNLHGVNATSPEHLNISLFSQIKDALPSTLFTLHGGSGVSPDQIRSAISLGVVKININTDLRLKFGESLRNQITVNHSEKIYEYLTPVIADVKKIIIDKLTEFSSP